MTHDKDAKNDENYLADLIMDFVEYIEIEQGRSIRTAENYNLYMDRLVEFAGNIPVSQITDELVRKYRLWLNRFVDEQGRELSLITQSYHLIALRSFLKYCSQRDIPTLDVSRVNLPRTQKKQVSFLLTIRWIERGVRRRASLRSMPSLSTMLRELLRKSGLSPSDLVCRYCSIVSAAD